MTDTTTFPPRVREPGGRGRLHATIMDAAGDIRGAGVPDPSIVDPTDAIVRRTKACIRGSDPWADAGMAPSERGRSTGREVQP